MTTFLRALPSPAPHDQCNHRQERYDQQHFANAVLERRFEPKINRMSSLSGINQHESHHTISVNWQWLTVFIGTPGGIVGFLQEHGLSVSDGGCYRKRIETRPVHDYLRLLRILHDRNILLQAVEVASVAQFTDCGQFFYLSRKRILTRAKACLPKATNPRHYLAHRKPMFGLRSCGRAQLRFAQVRYFGSSAQDPPRITRYKPVTGPFGLLSGASE
jgi:hypothetical protein